MEFGNPIVGQEDLIRSGIKSPNFNTDPQSGNVTGWRIAQDGTATFYNLVVGSQNFNIDENGNAVFKNVTADSIVLGGMDVASMLLNMSYGVQALATITGTSAGYTGTAIKVGEIIIPNFDRTRQYVIGASNFHIDMGTSTTVKYVKLAAYLAYDRSATPSDSLFFSYQHDVYTASGFDQDLNFRHPWNDLNPSGTDAHISLYLTSNDTSGQISVQGRDVTAQAVGARIYVEDVGPAITYTSFNLGTGSPPVQTYTKTYSANGSASFQSDGTNRSGFDGGHCYQGYYSSTNGNQFSCITFPYTTISSDLSGATITKTEVYLSNLHWYNNSGGTAIIGYHNFSSVSGNVSYPSGTADITEASFTYGQAKWVTVSNTIGNAFKNGTAKGIMLGKGPSNSTTYYGYFAGNGQTGEPQLRITYQK
jgi:hypothetical protein